MSTSLWRSFLAAATFFVSPSLLLAQDVLNVDFRSTRANDTVPAFVGEAAYLNDPADSAAIWNDIDSGTDPDLQNLVDSFGNASSVTLEISANTAGPFTDHQELQGGYFNLMHNYFAVRSANAATQTVIPATIGGLVPNSSYDLYFYGQGDQIGQNTGFRIGDEVRQTSYDGVWDGTNQGGDGLLVEDVEYVKFTGITASAGGVINFDYFNLIAGGIVDTDTGLDDVSADENGMVLNPENGALISAYDRHGGFNGFQIVGDIPPPITALEIEVNTTTGEVILKNPNPIAIGIDDYSITTDQNTLDTSGWSTLEDQGVNRPGNFNGDNYVDAADYTVWRDNEGQDESALDGNGDGSGTVDAGDYDLWAENYGSLSIGWEAAGFASDSYLGEFFLGGSDDDLAVIAPGAEMSLGTAFDTSVLGAGVEDNTLVFEYFGAGGATVLGDVSFVSGAATAVPEPTSLVLVSGLIAASWLRRREGVA